MDHRQRALELLERYSAFATHEAKQLVLLEAILHAVLAIADALPADLGQDA